MKKKRSLATIFAVCFIMFGFTMFKNVYKIGVKDGKAHRNQVLNK